MSSSEQIAWCLVAYLGWTVAIALVGKRPGPRDPDQTRWSMPWQTLLWPLLPVILIADLVSALCFRRRSSSAGGER